ncbi:hypothetical protein RclHR1_01420024 [Rhizophagus clarus]|uniref:MIR domain-containing protein n=1 Tax=Rhizophagus clarus TaxID=94130 RepID=A0A2Z6QSM0_9GLOM|nr:hypothetical protein RclHR1_01420024 [Rhizophagus clarus]GES95079.1 hypothetical protein GLOIN_2v1767340 [Rhizophagus clarus]
MDISKYDGNVHPDEWINDIQKFCSHWENVYGGFLKTAISLVDPTIKLPTEINDIEKLRKTLKEDISFEIFKNTNKRKLQSLKYYPERKGGDTSKFISTFRKLCYNAEINDIEEQKKYLYKSLPNNHFDYISNEFYNKMKNVKSINELIKGFENIILEESNLIRNESIIALKHVSTGKYLSSISNLRYSTGSEKQLVFAGDVEPDPNSLWKIQFDTELATYTDTSIKLQHIQSNKFLGICYQDYQYDNTKGRGIYCYRKSPLTNHTEVNCGGEEILWKFNHKKSENQRGYLKSNDIININIKRMYDENGRKDGQVEFLRSHDVHFTIGNDTFQEVVCHNERLGGNDEWCIELIHEVKIF